MALIAENTAYRARIFWLKLAEYAFIQSAATEKTLQAMARSFGHSITRIFLSINAGIVSPRQNHEQWARHTRLVAKLSKAPFWVLVGLGGFYVIFALVVGVLASLQTLGDQKNVVEAQVRLSVDVLAAKAFKSDAFRAPVTKGSELFNERRGGSERVALVQNEVSKMDLVVVDAMRS
ncbi:hypothetical protein FPQ18DRAFT_401125 [Pyronema domesticum]|uniref:Uncharacterized protein n=1 Tax=Pyronema omphalodes (strain CBS 100304) TaxID=1076935 RepID=U4L9Q0_PYROM|nr:hypothetical protein FPQ18DRAFT_401125 [Pyronema domesticum]CCX06914.1 Similar to hypothetical protein ASPNIDRAFT_187232 [Aspergillus niger ATCC 1015]; acc. no. EHA18793 [Pyronema omphalodes CBS 100304]